MEIFFQNVLNWVTAEREKVWDEIVALGEHKEVMLGDFNELFSNEDKRGGRLRTEASFMPFRTMLNRCGLLELPYEGNPYSWFGHRYDELVHCKLDLVVSNTNWFLKFPAATSYYLPRIGSDHSPVLLKCHGEDHKKRGQFRFDTRWVQKEGFSEAVSQGWSRESLEAVDIIQLIRNCRSTLASWKRNKQFNSQILIRDLKHRIDYITHQDSFNNDEYAEHKAQLTTAYNEEEIFWKNQSRIQWLKQGDRNSKFFHATVRQRRTQNHIRSLLNEETGQLLHNDREMGLLACSFCWECPEIILVFTLDIIELSRLDIHVILGGHDVLLEATDDL